MSKASTKVHKLFKSQFANYKIVTEHYTPYRGNRLFFDFFIPELKLLVEVQGNQHFQFNSFFHSDKKDLTQQKFRDTLKTEWADEMGYKLLTLTEDEIFSFTEEAFRQKVIDFI